MASPTIASPVVVPVASPAGSTSSDDTSSMSGTDDDTSSQVSSGDSNQSLEMKDCQNAALDALHMCQESAGNDPVKMEQCWQQIHSQLSACVPSDGGLTTVDNGNVNNGAESAAMMVFNESVLITDRMDSAIEHYLACMDSEALSSDRQSCVERLFTDINASVDVSKMSQSELARFNEAQNDLTDCLQQSTSIQHDFLCLRNFYSVSVDILKVPLIPVENKTKRVYATNKAIATTCYHQSTSTLRQCLQSIKNIQDPQQREAAKRTCLKEYRDLLQSCLCLSYGSNSNQCQK